MGQEEGWIRVRLNSSYSIRHVSALHEEGLLVYQILWRVGIDLIHWQNVKLRRTPVGGDQNIPITRIGGVEYTSKAWGLGVNG